MYDIINITCVLIVLLVFSKLYKVNNIYIVLLVLHLLGIFLFNGFLFNPHYMPDQFSYLRVAENIRHFDFLNEANFAKGNTVYFAGVFFGLFPIPFIASLHSISLINFVLYLIIFLFMHIKGFLRSKHIAYFYLLYPSLFLYSSVALRDMLIFFIMFFGIYYLYFAKNTYLNYFSGFLILLSLKILKFQNLLFMLIATVASMINVRRFKWKQISLGLVVLVLLFLFFHQFFHIEILNRYRYKFFMENILDMMTIGEYFFPYSYFDLTVYSLPNMVHFFFRPLPWKEFGLFQLAQFFENMGVFFIFLYIFYLNSKHRLWQLPKIKFLNVLLLFALLIYGLVMFNSGTAVRYKFPFIAVYILYSLYVIHEKKSLIEEKTTN